MKDYTRPLIYLLAELDVAATNLFMRRHPARHAWHHAANKVQIRFAPTSTQQTCLTLQSACE